MNITVSVSVPELVMLQASPAWWRVLRLRLSWDSVSQEKVSQLQPCKQS